MDDSGVTCWSRIPWLLLAALTACPPAAGAEPSNPGGGAAPLGAVYLDHNRPVESRIADLISRMTLREKVGQLGYEAPAIERLGIPAYKWGNECVHGVVADGATVFPQAIGLAATWNPELVLRVASAISDEARVFHRRGKTGLTFWSPVVNLARDPRWGRTQECYGEDPWLSGELGTAFVRGLQGDDPHKLKLVATPKHYAMNNDESQRNTGSANIDERLLFWYYLRPFRECVVRGGAQSVMCAYNAVNGVPCCANRRLLTGILRESWGFAGYVVSDCWAVNELYSVRRWVKSLEEAAAAALRAGVDLDCGRTLQRNLAACVRRGLVREEEVDRALARVLRARFLLGLFDPPGTGPYAAIPDSVVAGPEHRELARQAAFESLVLLKNAENILPLGTVKKLVVVGGLATVASLGSYSGNPIRAFAPLEGLQQVVPTGTEVRFVEPGSAPLLSGTRDYPSRAAAAAKDADAVIVVAGTDLTQESEGIDRKDLELPGRQEELLEAVAAANPRTILVLINGCPLSIRWAAEHIPAILEAWFPGEEGGMAIAEALFGGFNPGGKLPVTVPRSADDLPPMDDYDIRKGRTYMFAKKAPLFPFGFGLSYTTFSIRGLDISPARITPGGSVGLSVEVKNTGQRRGDEVVQVYLTPPPASDPSPLRVLRGAQRIGLEPGETKLVRFTLGPEELASLGRDLKPEVLPGTYRLVVGPSSATGLAGSFEVGEAQTH